MMKIFTKKLLPLLSFMYIIAVLMGISGIVKAQSSANYTFTNATNASFTDMSSGTTTLLGASFASQIADYASAVIDLSTLTPDFDFWFMGTRYYQFSVNSNGILRLGGTVVGTTFTNDLNTTANSPLLTAFWDDLDQTISASGKVHYKITGTFPNRVLTIEWAEFLFVYSGTAGATSTFQVKLYETTGKIEYVYGAMNNATTAALTTASIGFTTGANTNNTLVSVTSISTPAVTTTAASVVDNLVNNSTDGAISGLNGTTDGSRVIYTFSQTAPSSPTSLTFSNVDATSMTLNWTDNASDEFGYVIYTSTDNVTFTFNSQVAAGSTSASVTGLLANTVYYFRVYAVREGALSGYISDSQLSATATTYPTSGSINIPCGVTSVVVGCWGSGGGGGAGSGSGGSGGGGGAYSSSTKTVTPGTIYYYSVGSAGVGNTGAGAGTAGGDSWFNSTGVNGIPGSAADGVLAKGGVGGPYNSGGTAAGGASASGYGDTKYSGGTGADGGANDGAGGGSSAGTGAIGGNGGVPTGGTAPVGGGNGGNGSGSGNGSPGIVPGGGGGGANDDGTSDGGNGALGQITISYPAYVANAAPTGASATVTSGCYGTFTTLTQTGGTLGTHATWYWYKISCGGTLVGTSTATDASLTTILTETTSYYVRAEGGACASTTTCGSVAVTTTPAAPTGSASQTFCSGATVANLTATGTSIKWYSVSSGGSQLSGSTLLVNGTHYYASQTVSGCEGTSRFDVTATVNASPVATATSNSPVAIGSTLTLTGGPGSMTTYSWVGPSYSSSAQSPTVSASATAAMSGTYALTVTNGSGCSSAASTVVVVEANGLVCE